MDLHIPEHFVIHHFHHYDQHNSLVTVLTHLGDRLMSALEDFTQAVKDFTSEQATDLAALNASLTDELRRVAAALTAANTANDPAIAQATASLQAATSAAHSGLQAAVDSLNSELPEPPAEPVP